jgi:Arc/MetJ family transcription regulator
MMCARPIFTTMQTTLDLDDDLPAAAERYTRLKEKSVLVREALRALIERESARRLAALGGSEPNLKPGARRKTPT